MGEKLGKFILFFLIIFILLFCSINLWNLSNFISYQYLYKTPSLVISILFMIPVIYALFKGIKTIGRIHLIFFYINIILLWITVIFVFLPFNFDDLFPVFQNGFNPILKGSFLNICYNVLPIFLLTIIEKENSKITKPLIKVYLYSYLTLFIVIISIMGIFGYELANLYQYPEYHLLKTINIGTFFRRVEAALSMQWLFDLLVSISIPLYFILEVLKKDFKIKVKITPIIVGIIIIYISKILFNSNTQAHFFLLNIYPYLLFGFFFIIPLIVYLLLQFRRSKKANYEKY